MENMERQSVRIGVDRFYYATIESESESGGIVYDTTTIHLPGVTAVTLNPYSDISSFYADDGVFETFVIEGEKKLQVSFSGISNEVAAYLLGASYNQGLTEDRQGDSPPYVAIGFRSQKSNGAYRYVWIYKGRFSRSQMTSYTKSNSISPQSDIFNFKAVGRLSDGAWRRMLDSDDGNVQQNILEDLDNVSTGWFSSPYFYEPE